MQPHEVFPIPLGAESHEFPPDVAVIAKLCLGVEWLGPSSLCWVPIIFVPFAMFGDHKHDVACQHKPWQTLPEFSIGF